eukprot:506345-Amphidinium_carterae.1
MVISAAWREARAILSRVSTPLSHQFNNILQRGLTPGPSYRKSGWVSTAQWSDSLANHEHD